MTPWIVRLCLLLCIAVVNDGAIAGEPTEREKERASASRPSPPVNPKAGLAKAARNYLHGIFLIGTKKSIGTGWVLSKEHRLLVTNAHVADFLASGEKVFAVASYTSTIYRVEKSWYHPGVRRYLQGSELSVRSSDPKVGRVDPACPDLAIVKLAETGPDLPIELTVGSWDDLKGLAGSTVAMCGFPGHDTGGLPDDGEVPAATFHDGAISQLTDFQFQRNVPHQSRQFLQYTMNNWGGFSGSPVFLPSGRVIGVNNMMRQGDGGKKDDWVSHGPRIDCLFELIVHHGLQNNVLFAIDNSLVHLDQWLRKDPQCEDARARVAKAEALVNEAERLANYALDFDKAEERCLAALKIAPKFPQAYHVHGITLSNKAYHQLTLKDRRQLNLAALEKHQAAFNRISSEPRYELFRLFARQRVASDSNDSNVVRNVIAELNRKLGEQGVADKQKALIRFIRGDAYFALNVADDALRDLTEAIQLCPDPAYLDRRADLYESMRMTGLAQGDRAQAAAQREEERTP